MVSKVFIAILFLSVCHFAAAQKAELIKLPALQRLIKNKEKKVSVINFWATWCGPCVKEIPLFEILNTERKDIKVLLISMDMDLDPDPEKVWKFVERKKILSPVYILNERNPNDWIDKIDESWSGSLPATLILNTVTGKRKFIEHELHEGELERLITDIQ
jgi:thiol-disulfide isomerase/thioredoxin